MTFPTNQEKNLKFPKKSTNRYSDGVCFFVPPVLLEKKIKEGTEKEKDLALRNLKLSQLIRGQRSVNAKIQEMAAAAHQTKRRVVYNMNHSGDVYGLPGSPVRYENSPDKGDEDIDTCYTNIGLVYDFYKAIYNRNSINDGGMTMVSSVHFDNDYDNAFWNGRQMVYGDGSGTFMKKHSLTMLVVTAHELTHGVTQSEAGLNYSNEPGGLNESMSDCFGIMCEQWANKETVDKSEWLIGKGMLVEGKALRSMKDPGTAFEGDPQISNMQQYSDGMDPHISSGIGNKAFYLACTAVGGNSWDKVGKAWYIALKDRLRPESRFQDAADNTYEVAGSLFGEGSDVQNAIKKAWSGVGIDPKKPNLLRTLN